MKAPCAHGNSLHVTARLMLSSMTSKTLRCKYSDFDVFPDGIVNHSSLCRMGWDFAFKVTYKFSASKL